MDNAMMTLFLEAVKDIGAMNARWTTIENFMKSMENRLVDVSDRLGTLESTVKGLKKRVSTQSRISDSYLLIINSMVENLKRPNVTISDIDNSSITGVGADIKNPTTTNSNNRDVDVVGNDNNNAKDITHAPVTTNELENINTTTDDEIGATSNSKGDYSNKSHYNNTYSSTPEEPPQFVITPARRVLRALNPTPHRPKRIRHVPTYSELCAQMEKFLDEEDKSDEETFTIKSKQIVYVHPYNNMITYEPDLDYKQYQDLYPASNSLWVSGIPIINPTLFELHIARIPRLRNRTPSPLITNRVGKTSCVAVSYAGQYMLLNVHCPLIWVYLVDHEMYNMRQYPFFVYVIGCMARVAYELSINISPLGKTSDYEYLNLLEPNNTWCKTRGEIAFRFIERYKSGLRGVARDQTKGLYEWYPQCVTIDDTDESIKKIYKRFMPIYNQYAAYTIDYHKYILDKRDPNDYDYPDFFENPNAPVELLKYVYHAPRREPPITDMSVSEWIEYISQH